ncbi:uncharacterized protein BKCO1_15000155 [Diplodia corticola]|uniref:Myb-like domain-containing protein n=1 Tax=Diplodia corticola TaxID=236234 RepID=A0A1J9S5K6_9PEZI|nr:uncharacterized protein BKCO1_15000155 [Diplodia corticola]OJD35799.1 hypothetical protein BKCO1_15000155 [Diplodia corticola]
MLQIQQQPQPQARVWNSGGPVTNMKATSGQQWLTGLPPQFISPTKQRFVSQHLHSQLNQRLLHQRLFETQLAMNSPDWSVCPSSPLSRCADPNGIQEIFKFEDEHPLEDAGGLTAPDNNGLLPPGGQQNTWTDLPSQMPSQLSDQTSSSLQSSDGTHNIAGAWPLPLTEHSSVDTFQSSTTSSPGPGHIKQDSCPGANIPSTMSSSYSSAGATLFGGQTRDITPCSKAWMDSSLAAQRSFDGSSWGTLNQMDQYPNIPAQSYVSSQPDFSTRWHGLPFLVSATDQSATSALEPQLSKQTQAKRASFQGGPWDEADPAWPEWATLDLSCSSDSDMSSLVSPRSQCGAQAQFCVWDVNANSANSCGVISTPGLTHAQSSPAGDSAELSRSLHPGEQQTQQTPTNDPSSATYSQRILRPRAQSKADQHLVAFSPAATTSGHHAEWPTPASPQRRDDSDGYSRATAKRARQDDLLVQWKKAGMSYRQIREKGGFSEAESTLRGRYRTLTKRREERVRRPLWTQMDIRLLREGTHMLVAAALYPGMDVEEVEVDEADVDANKVPWKKVADYIWQNGGSYHFGNATCKKRWLKIQGML